MESIAVLFMYIVIGLVIVLLGVFFSFILYLYYIHTIYDHLPGPPRSSFIFGHALELSQHRKDGGTIMKYFLDKRLKHGPIFVMYFMHRALVLISDPEYIREIMVEFTHGSKAKHVTGKIAHVFGQRIIGNTCLLLNPDDKLWRKRRQLMNPAFHRKSLKSFVAKFNEVCDRFMMRIMGFVEGKQEISMVKEFSKVTLDVISKVAFNIKIGAIEDPNTPFVTAINSSLRGVQAGINSPFPAALLSIFQLRLFQSPSQKEQIDAVKFLRNFAFNCITNRLNDMKSNKNVSNDLLSLLVNDQTLTMEEIIDEFILIFIGGQDTTANSLSFTLFEIAKNPDIEKKILNEINNVLGSKENVDFDDLPKLKYLGQVLQESLRKYPVARGIRRILKKEVMVGGYRLPKGSDVLIPNYTISHSPNIWPNPEVFDPDRFSEPEKIPNLSLIYFPFAIAPRNCIGQNLAKFESKIILAKILRKFHFQLLPGQTSEMEEKLFRVPRDGVMCKVTMR